MPTKLFILCHNNKCTHHILKTKTTNSVLNRIRSHGCTPWPVRTLISVWFYTIFYGFISYCLHWRRWLKLCTAFGLLKGLQMWRVTQDWYQMRPLDPFFDPLLCKNGSQFSQIGFDQCDRADHVFSSDIWLSLFIPCTSCQKCGSNGPKMG